MRAANLRPGQEFGREPLDIAGVLAQLCVGGPLADAASAHRMASARLFAMPAVISVSTISSSGGLSRTITWVMSLSAAPALVVQGHDEAAPAVAAGVFEADPEVLDLRPPPGQLVPELLESRAVDRLEFLDCLAGFGPSSAPSGGFGEDQGGQQLSRLMCGSSWCDGHSTAHRAVREQCPYVVFDLALDAVLRGLVDRRPPAVTLVTQITIWADNCRYLRDELEC